MKPKQLRGKGIIPGSIYGRNLEETILIQIPKTDVHALTSKVSRGGTLTIEVDSVKYNVLFKNITQEAITQQVEHIEFQHIVANEAVNSVVHIVLTNRDKNPNLIQLHVEEIAYNALPRDFVQDVVLDLDGMNPGTTIKIEDLDIAKNENIKLAMPDDTIILTVVEKKRRTLDENTEDEEQES